MADRSLTYLFLQRFIENDLVSPDADRVQVLSQTCAALITGGLFVSMLLSLPYLTSPYPLPGRTAANMIRVQFLYAAWSSTVMALVAVSVWDALGLDSRDTEILGPLPVPPGDIIRAKIAALVIFAAGFALALNVVPALVHPILAVNRLQPSTLQVGTLVGAHITSTTAAAAFGFVAVFGLREVLHALIGPTAFRRISVVVRAVLVVLLVTVLLLIPVASFRVANLWLHGAIDGALLPPLWFAGIHDVMSGHIWAQLPRPDLPPSLAMSERAFEVMYQGHRPGLRHLGLAGGATFLLVLLSLAMACLWNNRRLPDPPRAPSARRAKAAFDAVALRMLARRPLVRAGLFFTMRILSRSVQNRLPIGVLVAIAIAVATVSLAAAGVSSASHLSNAPVAVLAVQLLFVAALVVGFRHSIRVPADLHARWVFHLIRPDDRRAYMSGVERAAVIKLVLPVLLALMPFHVVALGLSAAALHFAFGLLCALLLLEAALLGYRRLPFASRYVPKANISTHGGISAFIGLIAVYTVAWLEHMALSTTAGMVALLSLAGTGAVVIRGIERWHRRDAPEVALDEVVEPPTQRLGLMD